MAKQKLNSATQLSATVSPRRTDLTAISSSQTIFSIAPDAFPNYTDVRVFVGGSLLRQTADYTVTSTSSITLGIGVAIGTLVTIEWSSAPSVTGNMAVVESYVATAAQTTFPILATMVLGQERVFCNGIRKIYGASKDYTLSGNSIVFNSGRQVGDAVVVEILSGISGSTYGAGTSGQLQYNNSGTLNGVPSSGVDGSGHIALGGTTPNAASILDLQSTTLGFLPPRMTTAQRTAITGVAGLVVFDTDLGQLFIWT